LMYKGAPNRSHIYLLSHSFVRSSQALRCQSEELMPVRLIDSLASTEALAEVFSDRSILQAMLDFETALAQVEARLKIIPQAAADAIKASARTDVFDIAALSHDTLRAGTPGIALVKALTGIVCSKDAAAAEFVHWGATSQDVADTALILLLKRAQPAIEADLVRAEVALWRLAEQHAHTIMLGRTLLQAAPPVTFGLKVAGWLASIHRGKERLTQTFSDALLVQFGGASGTLAALGPQGPAVARGLAQELGLTCPDAPWHTHRDRLAAVVCACGVLTGSLGKVARDVTLLMQGEVSEVAEPGGQGRGGSSTMPHKRNPIGCAVTLAAANRMPGLVASFLSAMLQEHERAVGGWQSEWPTIAAVIQATGLAVASIAEIAEGLAVNSTHMRANLDATQGTIFAEKATFLLAKKLGRNSAQQLLEHATRCALEQGRSLAKVLGEMPEVTRHLDQAALGKLEVAEDYLGSADTFRTQQLRASGLPNTNKKKQQNKKKRD
jgi:3-carboxy-cis,cis-muconate cycloisomerase